MSQNTQQKELMSYDQALAIFSESPKSEQHCAEAEFGYKYMLEAVRMLGKKSRILEVGSGSGLLLSRLGREFPESHFTGLEPMGDGFTYNPVMYEFIDSLPNASIKPVGYEALSSSEKFDLIFLVNVFEHLPDWKDFMKAIKTLLNPDGKCIILCPNYSFPYEPHFRLPIFLNKSLTRSIFRKSILSYEIREDAKGLWKSLNFVKLRHVKASAKMLDLKIDMRKDILAEMVGRLKSDPEFASRQKLLKLPIFLLEKFGLIKLLLTAKIFENFLPYMHLNITHKIQNERQ